jgi:argininosuccinate synthase
MNRIVLAYSGGLETSVAIPWLAEHYRAEVIAVTFDLGQGRELADIRERALAIGAVRAHVLDVRDEFARKYVLPALQSGALDHGHYRLATALSRPLIARRLIEIARMERTPVIAHGCAPESNDCLRFETAARAVDPSITILAPARDWGMTRDEAIAYARARNIPIPTDDPGPYAIDTNLWGRSIMRGVTENVSEQPKDDIYLLTRAPHHCPDEPAYIDIEFEAGVPVRANGIEMPLVELIESVETIAGAHGVGRIDRGEDPLAGDSREIHEAPAAVLLQAAHRELEAWIVAPDLQRLMHGLGRAYADLVDDGRWFSTTREAIDAFVVTIQRRVTGSVRLKLFKGECQVVGRQSSFFAHDLATVDEEGRLAPATTPAPAPAARTLDSAPRNLEPAERSQDR